jgi:hypothetical protein
VGVFSKISNFFKNQQVTETDPYAELASTTGVHYNSAKLTHKEATRKMREYGMSAHYNLHNQTWTVKYGERTSIDESFRVAVQKIKVD